MFRRNFLKVAIAALAGIGLVKPQGRVLSTAEGRLIKPNADTSATWTSDPKAREDLRLLIYQDRKRFEAHFGADLMPPGWFT